MGPLEPEETGSQKGSGVCSGGLDEIVDVPRAQEAPVLWKPARVQVRFDVEFLLRPAQPCDDVIPVPGPRICTV